MTRIISEAPTASRILERRPATESTSHHPAAARRFRWRGVLSAAAIALASLSPLVPDARAVSLNTQEQELARFLSEDRGQQRDRGRMMLDPILTAVARSRAADMARRHYFSHTNPDGYGPNFLARSAGYELPSFWSNSRSGNFIESISAGQPTAAAAWDTWMHSASHRTHLLARSSFYRDQTNFGVGVYSDPSSPYRHYWVVITAPPSPSVMFTRRDTPGTLRVSAAVSVPVGSSTRETKAAPRVKVARPPVSRGKLWNWIGPIFAPRPVLIGAGA